MSKRTLMSLTTLLALTAGCGDEQGSSPSQDAVDEHIEITGLAITSEGPVSLLHPLRIELTAELRGEPWEADVVVGLRTPERDAGCVLGPMLATHDSEGPSEWTDEAEFFVSYDCAELVDRDELELFAAFDPFDELGDGQVDAGPPAAGGPALDPFSIVHASAISLAACDECGAALELHPSPGLDAQMLSAGLSSTVAILQVADPDTDEPAVQDERPDLMLTSTQRVTGLLRGRDFDDDQVQLVHRIRPLGSSDLGLALTARDVNGARERVDVAITDSSPVTSIAALYFEDATLDAVIDGVWSDVEEFELVSCLETEFDQAVYAGEHEPRANDCATIPVLVVREVAGAEQAPADGAAKVRSAEVYSNYWAAGAAVSEFGTTSLSLETWLDVNGATEMTQTYKGIRVHSAGSWFEAGIEADAWVFGHYNKLVDLYATFLAYDFGGGGVAMGATVFGVDFIRPFEIQLRDGVPMTLQQMFDASGLDLDPSITTSIPLASVGFSDGCDTISASVSLEGTIGIDTNATSITASSTPRGVKLSGTVKPYLNLAAVAEASFDLLTFIGGGINGTLNLLTFGVPFTVSAELDNIEGLDASRLKLSESAFADFEVLSGSISLWVDYLFDSHSFTIASWSGLEYGFSLFSTSQIFTFGSETPYTNWCGHAAAELYSADFDGDGGPDYLCHDNVDGRKWIDFHDNGFGGTDFYRAAQWCFGSGYQVHVGDFNGDGRDDMLCHAASRKSIDYADQDGELWGTDWYKDIAWCTHAGARLRVEDVDGDGRDDLRCVDTAGNQWIDYADQSGHFDGTDWSGTASPGSFCDLYDGQTVNLRSAHGRYLDVGYDSWLEIVAVQSTSSTGFVVDCIGEKARFKRSMPYVGSYYVSASNSLFGYDVAFNGPSTWTPKRQSDGTWAFQSEYNRFLSAASGDYGWNVRQQTYIGSWEKFTVIAL